MRIEMKKKDYFKRSKYLQLVLYLWAVYQVTTANKINTRFEKISYDNYTTHIHSSSRQTSLMKCAKSCSSHKTTPFCVRFNYHFETQNCSLFIKRSSAVFSLKISNTQSSDFVSYQVLHGAFIFNIFLVF